MKHIKLQLGYRRDKTRHPACDVAISETVLTCTAGELFKTPKKYSNELTCLDTRH